MYTELTYETKGHVGVITLNRPQARNALTHTTYAELDDAVRTTTARCLVITGADPAFCSGDDVKVVMVAADEIAANPPLAVQRLKQGLRKALDPDWEDLGRWVSSSLGELFATEDHKEGVASFLEKREPRFVGR